MTGSNGRRLSMRGGIRSLVQIVEKRRIVLSHSLTKLCKMRAEELGRRMGHGVRHFPRSFVFRLAPGRFSGLGSRFTASD